MQVITMSMLSSLTSVDKPRHRCSVEQLISISTTGDPADSAGSIGAIAHAQYERLKLDLQLKDADNRFLQEELDQKDKVMTMLTEGLKEVRRNVILLKSLCTYITLHALIIGGANSSTVDGNEPRFIGRLGESCGIERCVSERY